MERTPPTTRTKDDANKELHEIELKINKENAKLEIAKRDSLSAEEKIIDKLKRVELGKDAVDILCEMEVKEQLNKDILDLEEQISDKNRVLIVQNTSITDNNNEIDAQKTELIKQKMFVDSERKTRGDVAKQTNSKLIEKQKELLKVESEIKIAISEKEEIYNTIETKKNQIKEREDIVRAREISAESTKSTLRIMSARLYRKYGDKMTKHELEQVKT